MRNTIILWTASIFIMQGIGLSTTVLWEKNCSGSAGTWGIYDEGTFSMGRNEDWTDLDFAIEWTVAADNTGTTLHINSGTEFEKMAACLTNEQEDAIFFRNINSANTYSDYYDLFGDGTDLSGYTISSISLTINSLIFDSPGVDPNDDGLWTNYSYDVTYRVWGNANPEPATVILLGLGALVLRKHRK